MVQAVLQVIRFVLDVVFGSLCPGCGARGRGAPCRSCTHAAARLRLGHGASFEDRAPVRELLRAAKFGHWGCGVRWFAPHVIADARTTQPVTGVTWVPSDPGRVRQRGIDLPRAVARRVARELDVPCFQVLTRVHGSHTQRGLDRFERDGNAQASFDVHRRAERRIAALRLRGGAVLLVDDVCTTGATLRVCQTLLGIVLRRRFHDVHVRPHAIAAVPPPELAHPGVPNSRSLRGNLIHVER